MRNEKYRLYAVCPECCNSTWLPRKGGFFECLACGEKVETEEMIICRADNAIKPSSTGFIRRVDDSGRLVIPREIRQKYLIAMGDPFELFEMDGMLCFAPFTESTWNIQALQRLKSRIMEGGCLTDAEKGAVMDRFREIEIVLNSVLGRKELPAEEEV